MTIFRFEGAVPNRCALGALAALAGFSASLARAEGIEVAVPSGQSVTYVEMLGDTKGPAGLTYRFRFVAPAIARDGGTIDAETALVDMQALCDTFALPRIAKNGPQPQEIIISLSDRAVAFGEADPEVTQFFESFRPADGICEVEGF